MKIPNKIVDTFLEYKITTSGDDLIKKGFKGREIGQEKERIEKEKFLKLMNESKKKVSYSGVILNEESRKLLKKYIPHPKDWEFIGHHMTINMGPLKEESKPLLDQPFDLLVTHIGQTDKVVAVKVESEIKTQNKIPHITIAVNRMEGGKPVMSNDITEWSPIYPFEVEGKVEEISI
jgi:hypothetical protein